MKVTFMEKTQHWLERHRHKGFGAIVIYAGIILFLAVSVILKFVGNLFQPRKSRLK